MDGSATTLDTDTDLNVESVDDKPPRRGRRTNAEQRDDTRTRRRTGTETPTPHTVKPGARTLHEPLEEFFAMLAMPFAMAGDYYCAYIITTRTPPFATAMADLAEKNPALKRRIQKFIEGGEWGKVIYTGLAVALPIGFHHGLDKLGLINPFALNPLEQADFEQYMANITGVFNTPSTTASNGAASTDATKPQPIS